MVEQSKKRFFPPFEQETLPFCFALGPLLLSKWTDVLDPQTCGSIIHQKELWPLCRRGKKEVQVHVHFWQGAIRAWGAGVSSEFVPGVPRAGVWPSTCPQDGSRGQGWGAAGSEACVPASRALEHLMVETRKQRELGGDLGSRTE